MAWEDHLAERVVEEMKAANKGRLYETKEEFENTIQRFDGIVRYFDGPPQRSCVQDNIVYAAQPSLDTPISHPANDHEAAELALCWEGTEPFAVPTCLPPEQIRHNVALRVETYRRRHIAEEAAYCVEGESIPFPDDDQAPSLEIADNYSPNPSSWGEAMQALYHLQQRAQEAEQLLAQLRQSATHIKQTWRV